MSRTKWTVRALIAVALAAWITLADLLLYFAGASSSLDQRTWPHIATLLYYLGVVGPAAYVAALADLEAWTERKWWRQLFDFLLAASAAYPLSSHWFLHKESLHGLSRHSSSALAFVIVPAVIVLAAKVLMWAKCWQVVVTRRADGSLRES